MAFNLENFIKVLVAFDAQYPQDIASEDLLTPVRSFSDVTQANSLVWSRLQARHYWVALSGGLDSTVLLHAMLQLREKYGIHFSAVHVNHQLHKDAELWTRACQTLCDNWNIPLISKNVSVNHRRGDSLEAVARDARYQAMSELILQNDVLLTAHHADDQAETLLLRMLRGSGTTGLSSIPRVRSFVQGWLIRPLLDFNRQELKDYAIAQQLTWLEDPSNEDVGFDRNFIRHEVIPLLKGRWPALTKTFSRVARHAQNESTILDEYANYLLFRCQGESPNQIDLAKLNVLSASAQKLVLRCWIRGLGRHVPDEINLQRVLNELIPAPSDANPEVNWGGQSIRRFQDGLWLVNADIPQSPRDPVHWLLGTRLDLSDGLGSLSITKSDSGISQRAWDEGEVSILFRTQGMRCQPAGRHGVRPIKKIFQELGVPPWERHRIPLVFINSELAAISNLLICEKYFTDQEAALRIQYSPMG